jgi:hypothetical protein
MLSSTILTILALLLSASAWPLDNIKTVIQFPNNTFVENIAARSNGQILATTLTSANLVIADPEQPGISAIVHTFANFSALTGIVEYKPDVFAVSAGGYKFLTPDHGSGTWNIFSVDMRNVTLKCGKLSSPPKVTKITAIPEAGLLNGMALLSPEDGTLAVAESLEGSVYRVDTTTGAYSVVVNNTYTKPGATPAGVNGLHVWRDFLYFSNGAQSKIYKLRINKDGTAAGNVTLAAEPQGYSEEYDDFAVDCQGAIYAATGAGNSIKKIHADGSQELVSGNINSTAIAEPTSVVFGKGLWDKNVIYVGLAGGSADPVNGDITVPGKVVALNTNSQGCYVSL